MMTDQERLARLEARQEDLERRINTIEQNEVWKSRTIMGLIMTTAFNIYTKLSGGQ